jgi:DNA replication protein DnaC
LVNSRYNAHLPTVFTSNVAITKIDPRIASRMHDHALGAEIVMMSAGDYRQRKPVSINRQY